jgi:hypothetical protein
MREKLSRRLMRLEEIHAAAVRAQAAEPRPGGLTAAQIIQIRLGLRGLFPIGNESLAETLARAFGMSSQELRHLMAGPAEAFNAKLQSL